MRVLLNIVPFSEYTIPQLRIVKGEADSFSTGGTRTPTSALRS